MLVRGDADCVAFLDSAVDTQPHARLAGKGPSHRGSAWRCDDGDPKQASRVPRLKGAPMRLGNGQGRGLRTLRGLLKDWGLLARRSRRPFLTTTEADRRTGADLPGLTRPVESLGTATVRPQPPHRPLGKPRARRAFPQPLGTLPPTMRRRRPPHDDDEVSDSAATTHSGAAVQFGRISPGGHDGEWCSTPGDRTEPAGPYPKRSLLDAGELRGAPDWTTWRQIRKVQSISG